MEPLNMRKFVLFLSVAAIPVVASASDFTVPAIVEPAQAAPETNSAIPPADITASTDPAPTDSDGRTALPNHPPPALTVLSPNTPLTPRERRATSIAQGWRSLQASPAPGTDGSVNFTFGASIPAVVCSPLYVCSISLQPGEVVNDIKAGDSVRWLISPSIVGTGANQQTIVTVKPTDAGLRTNLVIATTRRLYEIELVSNSTTYTDDVTFTYPEDAQTAWQQYRAEQQQQEQTVAATTLATGQNLAALDFNFTLSGGQPAWRPLRVYSDGIKTYIQFPRSMLSGDAPALVALGDDGGLFSSPTKQIVNYRVEGDTYVVDRVLSRAALISGVGGNQDEVQITHQGGHS